jgi:hypothetical protein
MKITFREAGLGLHADRHGFPERVNEPRHGFQLCSDLYFHPPLLYFAAEIALHYNYYLAAERRLRWPSKRIPT